MIYIPIKNYLQTGHFDKLFPSLSEFKNVNPTGTTFSVQVNSGSWYLPVPLKSTNPVGAAGTYVPWPLDCFKSSVKPRIN